MSKQDLAQGIHRSFGNGVAIAGDRVRMPSAADPKVPEEGLPNAPYAADVETYCKTNKCSFLGQDESDPSFLCFKQDGSDVKFKLPQSIFLSGFRGSNEAK